MLTVNKQNYRATLNAIFEDCRWVEWSETDAFEDDEDIIVIKALLLVMHIPDFFRKIYTIFPGYGVTVANEHLDTDLRFSNSLASIDLPRVLMEIGIRAPKRR